MKVKLTKATAIGNVVKWVLLCFAFLIDCLTHLTPTPTQSRVSAIRLQPADVMSHNHTPLLVGFRAAYFWQAAHTPKFEQT